MQNNVRRHSSNPQASGGAHHRTASRSASFKLGKKGTAGNPAPSWIPNVRRDSTYDSRPSKSIRQQMPETFRNLEPEQGSRIFVSGLPKDITNQDLEDLMTSQIGPTREVYIIHQYTGQPLYKSSSATSSGLERDPSAESAENIRFLSSTGCGMVHFQREKDALEAWEQYNGKLLDGESKILRVQIVVDADESWLLPNENIRTLSALVEEPEAGMEVEPIKVPPVQPRAMRRGIPSPTLPARLETGRVVPVSVQPLRRPRGGGPPPIPKPIQRPPKAKPMAAAKLTYNGIKPLSNSLPLLNRIGTLATLGETVNGKPSISVAFGGHLISLNASATSQLPIVSNTMASRIVLPRGKVRKGPRRLAKLEARNQQLRETVVPMAPIAPIRFLAAQPNVLTSGITPMKQRLVDLDAEMEEYRRTGLMGLSSSSGR